jgi:hypothetical protein
MMLFNPKWDAEGKAESWRQVLLHAADLIDRVGWCQHTECDQNGRVCTAEALNRVGAHDVAAYAVAMTRLSDFVASPVTVPEWNDAESRTAAEVTSAMRACARQ